ncbi:type IX secretion system sortase PorU [candidate division KSB1 bacterium]|nr:type IX secretion system sortase PorU [candidate division KSB1 bacterium]RQW11425.1 MAG: type IX secretion system sortase PorU [candidate division KSB1 bacterium]
MRKTLSYIFILGLLAPAFVRADQGVRVVSATAEQMTIEFEPVNWRTRAVTRDAHSYQEISFDGAITQAEPGLPQIPVKVLTIGVPEDGDALVQVIDSEFQTLENVNLAPLPRIIRAEIGATYAYDQDESYQSDRFAPESLVRAEEPHYFRSQRIVRIYLQPLHYNPVQRRARQFTRIVLQINYTGTTSAKKMPPDPDAELYKGLLLNDEQAKNWRTSSERPALRKVDRHFFQGDNWFKLTIAGNGAGGKEGMHKVSGAALREALAKKNISLSSIDVSTIQIFNNGGRVLRFDQDARNDTLIENPILVVGEADGRLDDSDYILFYGRSLEGVDYDPARDQLKHYINPYGYDNVYWLTFNRASGKRIRPVSSQAIAGRTVEPFFKDLAWIEEEKVNIFKSGITWLGHEMRRDNNAYSVTFPLPGALAAEDATVRTAIASLTTGQHYFSVYVNGNSLGQFDQYGGATSYSLIERVFNEQGVLMDGDNTVTINYNVGSDLSFSYVDYIELEYKRRFRAINDLLMFYSPLKNDVLRYQIDGFSSSDVRVFDVTDIRDIREIIDLDYANGAIDFADQATTITSRRYVALASSAYKNVEAAAIAAVTVTGLRQAKSVDYIIITHDDFRRQAEQLESLRENWNPEERLATQVLNISDVINEFGWGLQDPAAIRNFLGYARENWGDPGYVLLFGDGHFDYKNILRNNVPNLIIPYETAGQSETNTRVTDDWYTYLNGDNSGMQMAIGRLVPQTVDEAQNAIDKIVDYETNPDYGEWLKTVTIVADDEYTNDTDWEKIHTEDAEDLAERHVPELLDVKKIYLINYPEVRTASITGREKPAATLDLLEQINSGSLLINYIGHGNPDLWAHERLLLNTRDFEKIQNGRRMALWVAATCEFAHWDQPTSQSFAEDILNASGRGAVAMVSSARLAYASDNAAFNKSLYDQLFFNYVATGFTVRLGDAVMRAKLAGSGNNVNNEKYNLFGDPAMRLRAPRYQAVIDDIRPDSIQALSKMVIRGHIEDQRRILDGYEGKILVRTLDTRKKYNYNNPGGTSAITGLYTTGNTIFRGVATIADGAFNVQFIVPKDISYGGREGRISLYFWNDNSSGSGDRRGLAVGGTAVDLLDKEGPRMKVYFGDEDFVPGDYVSSRPTLHLTISDSVSGVNTAGDIGHQILLTLDQDYNNSIDITEYFTYSEGSYTDGALNYTILDLPIGEHSLQVKAWDNSNNSSIIETHFIVIDDSELAIRHPLTYPNPMSAECSFRYELSQDAEVSIKIFTVAGRLIKAFEPLHGHVGYNVFPESWDGRDDAGDPVANGVYLYKIAAKSQRADEKLSAEIVEKLIVVR